GQPAAVLELEHGDAAVRVDGEEFRRAGLALEDVLLDQAERSAELRQQQPDLVAVSRRQVVVQRQHVAASTTPGTDPERQFFPRRKSHSSSGAKPCRMVFSDITRGSTSCGR